MFPFPSDSPELNVSFFPPTLKFWYKPFLRCTLPCSLDRKLTYKQLLLSKQTTGISTLPVTSDPQPISFSQSLFSVESTSQNFLVHIVVHFRRNV